MPKNKHKIIKIIIIAISVIILLLVSYCIAFSPFHFWFMEYDADTDYIQGESLTYNNGKLYVAYNDDGRLDIVGTLWTHSKFLSDKASLGDIISDKIIYSNNNSLRVCDLNGNNEVEITNDLMYFTTNSTNQIYFTNSLNELYVYYIDNQKTEIISSTTSGDIYSLSCSNNSLSVVSGYLEYEADKSVYKSSIKTFDCDSFDIIYDTSINMNELGINSNDCYVSVIGDVALFFGKELGISYYSVNLSNSKITYLGEHSKSVSCTDDTSLYYLKNLYASSIYNTEVHDELWKLDIRSGHTEKIADFDVEYTEMLCTDNYIYLYRPMKLFPKENTLFNMDLGYKVNQIEKSR